MITFAAAFAHGDLHVQIERVTAQITREPASAELHLNRAGLYRLHEEWQAAAADYDKAERLAPDLSAVHLGRGEMLYATGRLEEAGNELDRFLKINPRHVEALILRGRIEAGRANPLAAAGAFSEAIAQAKRPEPEWYIEQARALMAAGSEHHGDEAIAALERGMEVLGNLPVLGLYAIEIETARSRFDSALGRLEKLSASARRQEHWLERRGDLLAKAGRHQEATRTYHAAIKAIADLPVHLRSTKAVSELENRLIKKSGTAF
ncbi:MAG: tetratricopeptide repeat protein [Verrucomicrobiota bacterium]